MPMLGNDDRIVGTAGFMTYEDPQNTETFGVAGVPITFWSVKCTKQFSDITSSLNYEWSTNLLYPTRLPVAMSVEGTVLGRFRLSVIPVTILAALYSGDILPVFTLYFNDDYEFGNGYFHVQEFEVSAPIDGVVEFQTKILSQGMFQANLTAYEVVADPKPLPPSSARALPMPVPPSPEDDSGL